MAYQVVFDVSQRLPQLAIGVVAAIVLAVVIAAGLWDSDAVLERWSVVFGVGAAAVALQLLIGGEWPYLLGGAVVVVTVLALERAGHAGTGRASRLPPGAGAFVLGLFALVFAALQGLAMIPAIDLNHRLIAGEASVVEGTVTVESFVKTECLVVANRRICYSEWAISPGYNRRQYLIGALESGSQVRLSIIDGLIVRLEVSAGG
jgi:hypothetical protein